MRRWLVASLVLIVAGVVAYAARDGVLRYRAAHLSQVRQFDLLTPYTGFGDGAPQDSSSGRITRDGRVQLILMLGCQRYTGISVSQDGDTIRVVPRAATIPHGTCVAMAYPIFVDVVGVHAADLLGRTLVNDSTGDPIELQDCRGVAALSRGSQLCYYPDDGGDPSAVG